MKGIVFVKFAEFIEATWGELFWDELLEKAELPSGGAYTSAGTYQDEELFTLIGLIVDQKGITSQQAQLAFGEWLFKELYAAAPPEAHQFTDVFSFLHGVQNIIHVEVKKLNPDALLPQFTFLSETEKCLRFHYQSPRKLCFFCEGLVHGLAAHVNQPVKVTHPECELRGDARCVLEVELI